MILVYFILGILFISILLPAIDNFMTIMSSWVEYKVYVLAFKIYKIKKDMGIDATPPEEEEQINPIGFVSTTAIGNEISEE